MTAPKSPSAVSPSPGGATAATMAWPSALQGWISVGIFFVAAIISYTDRLIFSLIVDPVRQQRADLRAITVSLFQPVVAGIVQAILNFTRRWGRAARGRVRTAG